jgi:hypothetical protein
MILRQAREKMNSQNALAAQAAGMGGLARLPLWRELKFAPSIQRNGAADAARVLFSGHDDAAPYRAPPERESAGLRRPL